MSLALSTVAGAQTERWWKGNTHTHSLWSDGDDFPEMIAAWYKEHGYHFLALTDHNTLAREHRWWPVPAAGPGREAYRKYRSRFGGWVEERRTGDTLAVRLRSPADYRPLLEQRNRFLLIEGEEITQYLARRAAHMNVLNVAEVIKAQPGNTLVEMLARDLERAHEQEATGRDVVAVLNHPNFLWSQTAEDLLALDALRVFEVYNGHPLVFAFGDSVHPSNERIWDIVLTTRLARDRGAPLLYGVATDDAHDYHRVAPDQRNPGRGWIMVRALRLDAQMLMSAIERGDFYASSGVELESIRRDGRELSLRIRGEPGVAYRTQFIGTRARYDTSSTAVSDSGGRALTRRYSDDVGAVLAEVSGMAPSYRMRGDELYVRARIVSSKPKANGPYLNEVEMAWTQPISP